MEENKEVKNFMGRQSLQYIKQVTEDKGMREVYYREPIYLLLDP